MSDKEEDIIDNLLEGSDELNDYLDGHVRDALKKIIVTMFNIHSYTDDPIRVFYMTNIIVNRYVVNFLGFYQDMAIETLKEYGVIADFTESGEVKRSMK